LPLSDAADTASGSSLRCIAPPADGACSLGGRTCGACCWSTSIPRSELEARLRRHLRLFENHLESGWLPGRRALLFHELRARHLAGVLLGLMQWLPFAGPAITVRIARTVVCPFAAFRDRRESRVGCLLHPTLWRGRDVRASIAFRLLPGFGCGAAAYSCIAAQRLASAPDVARRSFNLDTATLDWFEYGRALQRFDEDHTQRRDSPCLSSSTSH
jgi:hypothetical protein